jgi:hypothetical protein
MDNLARIDAPPAAVRAEQVREVRAVSGRAAVRHEAGRVVGLAPGAFVVLGPNGCEVVARRAASCLVAPADGDLVELSVVEGGGAYVVAVLEASAEGATRLEVEGDLELAPTGRLRLTLPAGVDVASDDAVSVLAGRVEVRAVDLKATFERATTLGKFLQQQVEKVRTVSSTVDMVAERLTQTVERCYRYVGESDTLRARRVDHEATGTMRLHAANAVVTADQLVKVDGGQIHMG